MIADKGEPILRVVPRPGDINANGHIFGGWVLSQMDQAGGIAAVERAQGRVVTIAVEAMTFIRPVKVGDVLCVYTQVDKVGRPDIDAFEAVMEREGKGGRQRGFFSPSATPATPSRNAPRSTSERVESSSS